MQIFAILFGILFGLLNFKIPSLVTEVITGCSNCLSPIAMILTGCVIAEFSIKKILSSLLVYKVVFARMIILPLIFISLAKFINLLPEIFFAIVAVQTMPTALNTVIFPASVGKDCNLGAGMACVSNILAIVLLPLSFYLFL
jgi:predicted permease